MLYVIRSFGDDLPASCRDTLPQTWSVFDAFLSKYGNEYDVAERANRVIRHGITFYGQSGQPVIVPLLHKLVSLFESSRTSSYLWICGKAIQAHGHGYEADEGLRGAISSVYQRSTSAMAQTLQTRPPAEIPDSTL